MKARAGAVIAFAVTAACVAGIITVRRWNRPEPIASGQKAAEAYINSVIDEVIRNGGLPAAATVEFTNVSAVRNDPRKIPWLWKGYTLLKVPVSSPDALGKTDATKMVWDALYQFDPHATSGRVIWFEMGHWIGPMNRHHMDVSEWTSDFRRQVSEAWIEELKANDTFAGAQRLCKRFDISVTEMAEILASFVEKKPVYKAKIPADVSWRVLEEHFNGSKRTIDVMLDGRLSKDVLREIAMDVKSLEKTDYEITDVNFYIPDQDKMLGCWASSRDSPDLKYLEIVGLTAEEAAHLLKLPLDLPHGSEFVGCWIREEPRVNGRYAIYGLNGRHFLVHWYANDADGSHRQTEKAREYASTTGRRFKFESSTYSYEVELDGTLRVYNEQGKLRGTWRTISPPLHSIAK